MKRSISFARIISMNEEDTKKAKIIFKDIPERAKRSSERNRLNITWLNWFLIKTTKKFNQCLVNMARSKTFDIGRQINSIKTIQDAANNNEKSIKQNRLGKLNRYSIVNVNRFRFDSTFGIKRMLNVRWTLNGDAFDEFETITKDYLILIVSFQCSVFQSTIIIPMMSTLNAQSLI